MAKVTQQEYQNVQNYVNSNYTADSLKNYTNAYNQYMSQGMSSNDAYNKASSLLVKKNTTNTSTPTSTQTTATQNSTNKNTTPTATSTNNNRNTGTYVDSDGYTSATQRNMATGGAEFGRSNATTTQKQTSTPATTTSSNLSNTKNMWDNLSYEQQQEKLNQIPGLKESLTKKGWAIKSPTAQGTQQTPAKSQANAGQWDYQDNSDARMMEIANNLNNYRVSNPDLFNDWDTFSNFFINGKGRSQEQIDYLKDYFNAVKQYNSYDNMSAPSVGEMVAKGQIPEGYLNYIKYANPDRYAEIMNYKDQTEKGIMNETYYANLVNNSDLADPEWMKWAKENQFIIDENNDNLDDRLYHEATDEEKTLVNEYSTLASEQLADQNTYRDLMSDLREQYPDADESTLMILAGDRGKKIQDRMDTRNVTMTKLNGQITYLQNERTTQNTAGQQTINQLQKAYGMYYDYSPQGMSELAQAQYAATNVTLDQADNGTDTQKQMALQSVLDGYYDKYGSIIQRSEQQVIGDVMAYAKEKGISLSQALEENFLKPLRSKPQFATLSSGGVLGSNPDVFKVGDNTYAYWDENGNLVQIGGGALGGTSVNTTALSSGVSSFVSDLQSKGYTIAPNGGTGGSKIRSGGCGTVVNDYLSSIGDDISLSEANDIKKYATSKTPAVGSIAYFDGTQSRATPETKKHGHVAIVVGDDGDKITVLESNTGTGLRYNTYSKSSVTGYYTPNAAGTGSQGYNPDLAEAFGKYSQANGNSLDEKRFREQYGKIVEGKGVDKDTFLKQYKEWYADMSKDAYLDILSNLDQLIEITGEGFSVGERGFAAAGIGDIGLVYDYVKNNLTVNGLQEARDRGLKLGVLSDSDVQMIAKAASKLGITASQETWNDALIKFRNSILNNNKYLKQEYQNKSAYSKNKTISFNDSNKKFTIGTAGGSNNNQGQQSSYQPKSITDMGKSKK